MGGLIEVGSLRFSLFPALSLAVLNASGKARVKRRLIRSGNKSEMVVMCRDSGVERNFTF